MTLISSIYSLFLYLTPLRWQSRLINLASVQHQILNLIIGRALPDLKAHIPKTDLTDRNVIVTGANSGIGLQIALELAARGASVVLACRSPSRGEGALKEILQKVPGAKGRVFLLKLDTSSLESVRDFARSWIAVPSTGNKKLDILCHNAGISHPPPGHDFTEQGIEILYATNFLGSFLLTSLLEPYLSADARVVLTSSTGQLSGKFTEELSLGPVKGTIEPGFHTPVAKGSDSARYGMTKAMQCAFAKSLQRRWDQASVAQVDKHQSGVVRNGKKTAHAFTPGFTMTPIFGKLEATSSIAGFLKSPFFAILKVGTVLATNVDQGAATGAWLACTQDVEVVEGGGAYWDRMTRSFSVADKMSEELLARLWTRWERDANFEWRT